MGDKVQEEVAKTVKDPEVVSVTVTGSLGVTVNVGDMEFIKPGASESFTFDGIPSQKQLKDVVVLLWDDLEEIVHKGVKAARGVK